MAKKKKGIRAIGMKLSCFLRRLLQQKLFVVLATLRDRPVINGGRWSRTTRLIFSGTNASLCLASYIVLLLLSRNCNEMKHLNIL